MAKKYTIVTPPSIYRIQKNKIKKLDTIVNPNINRDPTLIIGQVKIKPSVTRSSYETCFDDSIMDILVLWRYYPVIVLRMSPIVFHNTWSTPIYALSSSGHGCLIDVFFSMVRPSIAPSAPCFGPVGRAAASCHLAESADGLFMFFFHMVNDVQKPHEKQRSSL